MFRSACWLLVTLQASVWRTNDNDAWLHVIAASAWTTDITRQVPERWCHSGIGCEASSSRILEGKISGGRKRCSPAFLWLCFWPLCWHRRSRRQKSCLVLGGRSTWWTMCSTAPWGRSFAHIATRYLELSQRTHVSTMVIKHSVTLLPTQSNDLQMTAWYIFSL